MPSFPKDMSENFYLKTWFSPEASARSIHAFAAQMSQGCKNMASVEPVSVVVDGLETVLQELGASALTLLSSEETLRFIYPCVTLRVSFLGSLL